MGQEPVSTADDNSGGSGTITLKNGLRPSLPYHDGFWAKTDFERQGARRAVLTAALTAWVACYVLRMDGGGGLWRNAGTQERRGGARERPAHSVGLGQEQLGVAVRITS